MPRTRLAPPPREIDPTGPGARPSAPAGAAELDPSAGESGFVPGQRTRSTTVLCVRHRGRVALGADGQVSLQQTIVKVSARKVRALAGGRILAGFAGSAADGLALFELLEAKLEAVGGNFVRACVDLAKDWRMDRRYRRLEALMVVADREHSLLLSGSGDVIEPDDGILAIGSGGNYALAAARALVQHADLDARAVVDAGLGIAADICVYTGHTRTVLELPAAGEGG
jgi:ATP-dependent HslUV protease subunit HslV